MLQQSRRGWRVEALGGLDILVNNAGIGAAGDVADNTDEEWLRVHRRQRGRPGPGHPAALPALRGLGPRRDRQHLLDRRDRGLPHRALYTASKGAILSLTMAMAADHLREGIRVNAVTPARPTPPGSSGCSSR